MQHLFHQQRASRVQLSKLDGSPQRARALQNPRFQASLNASLCCAECLKIIIHIIYGLSMPYCIQSSWLPPNNAHNRALFFYRSSLPCLQRHQSCKRARQLPVPRKNLKIRTLDRRRHRGVMKLASRSAALMGPRGAENQQGAGRNR